MALFGYLPNTVDEVIKSVEMVFQDETLSHDEKRNEIMYLMGTLKAIHAGETGNYSDIVEECQNRR